MNVRWLFVDHSRHSKHDNTKINSTKSNKKNHCIQMIDKIGNLPLNVKNFSKKVIYCLFDIYTYITFFFLLK